MIDYEATGRGVVRAISSLFIAALFLLLLAVSLAQQQAVLALADSKMSYSVARKTVQDMAGTQAELAKVQKESAELQKRKSEISREGDALKSRFYAQSRNVAGIVESLRRSNKCFSAAELAAGQPETLAAWQQIQSCAAVGDVPKALLVQIGELQDPDQNPARIRDRIDDIEVTARANDSSLESTGKSITELTDKISKSTAASNALQDISVIDANPIFGFLKLTSIPPALMQIFLSFLGGLFGALLLTLILAVYPNSDLNFTAGEGYWNRILLGGLISVSVFVVVGGGVSVLGSSNALFAGETNFLSFCAIGILAGMFSDRVARWLSDRAEVFVDSRDDGQTPNS